MFFAIAALLIHPQIAPNRSLPAGKAEVTQAADSNIFSDASIYDGELPLAPVAADTTTANATAQPTMESSAAELPDALVPALAVTAAPPTALLLANPAKPMTISVDELRAEASRKERLWRGFAIASHGGATFDAWTTRHEITTAGAQELDPLLKPFAGNASLYLAIQVGPALMDYAARKMMYNRHDWVRRMWWAPQAASFVASMVSGAHNLSAN